MKHPGWLIAFVGGLSVVLILSFVGAGIWFLKYGSEGWAVVKIVGVEVQTGHVGVASLAVAVGLALIIYRPIFGLTTEWIRSLTQRLPPPAADHLPHAESRLIENRTYLIVSADMVKALVLQANNLSEELSDEEDCQKHQVKYVRSIRSLIARTNVMAEMTWLEVAAEEYGGTLKDLRQELSRAKDEFKDVRFRLQKFIAANKGRKGAETEELYRSQFRDVAKTLEELCAHVSDIRKRMESEIKGAAPLKHLVSQSNNLGNQ